MCLLFPAQASESSSERTKWGEMQSSHRTKRTQSAWTSRNSSWIAVQLNYEFNMMWNPLFAAHTFSPAYWESKLLEAGLQRLEAWVQHNRFPLLRFNSSTMSTANSLTETVWDLTSYFLFSQYMYRIGLMTGGWTTMTTSQWENMYDKTHLFLCNTRRWMLRGAAPMMEIST